jgi:hypothetical protein
MDVLYTRAIWTSIDVYLSRLDICTEFDDRQNGFIDALDNHAVQLLERKSVCESSRLIFKLSTVC